MNATLGAISASASIVNLTSCSFINNRVENNGEATGRDCVSGVTIGGGAVSGHLLARVIMTNCSFSHNQVLAHGNATGMGGAVLLADAHMVIVLCTFRNNMALQGGAMMVYSGTQNVQWYLSCGLNRAHSVTTRHNKEVQ